MAATGRDEVGDAVLTAFPLLPVGRTAVIPFAYGTWGWGAGWVLCAQQAVAVGMGFACSFRAFIFQEIMCVADLKKEGNLTCIHGKMGPR